MKRVVPLLLAAAPYLYAIIVWKFILDQLTDAHFARFLAWTLVVSIGILLLSGAFAFTVPERGATAQWLAFWSLVIKIACMPFYFLFLSVGLFVTMVGGFVVAVTVVALGLVFVLGSSVFAFSALREAERQGLMGRLDARLYMGGCFFMLLDVFAVAMLYWRLKKGSIPGEIE